MNSMQLPDTTVAQHFTILVYPFRDALLRPQRLKRLQQIEARWRPWFSRLGRADLKPTLDDTQFFLPYLRTLHFLETALLPINDASQQVTRTMQLASLTADEPADEFYGQGELPDGVLRLTYDPEHVQALHPLQLEFERKNTQGKLVEQFSAPMHLCWVDVALFP